MDRQRRREARQQAMAARPVPGRRATNALILAQLVELQHEVASLRMALLDVRAP